MERHAELEKDRGELQRFHIGHATAAIMTAVLAAAGSEATFDAGDVFGGLRRFMPDTEEQSESEIRAAMAGWPGARRTHHA